MATLFHLVEPETWYRLPVDSGYCPESLSREGFVHLSTREQVEGTAARFYSAVPALLVLVIDETKLGSLLRYEPDDGQLFPHLYGPLERRAIVEVHAMQRGAGECYRLPACL